MKHFFKSFIAIFFTTFVSCGLNNNGNIGQNDSLSYYQQESEKHNFNDTLFAGFSFAMDSSMAVQHAIEDSNIWPMYKTQYGRDRLYIFSGSGEGYNVDLNLDLYREEYERMAEYTSPDSPLDGYPYYSVYTTNMVLIDDDSTYKEKYVNFGLSYYKSQLYEITIAFHGKCEKSQYDVHSEPLLSSVVKTFQTKYGEPYFKRGQKAIWVNGITHITAYYYGIEYCHDKRFTDNGWEDCSQYYPVVIVKYTNYPLSQEYERELEKRIQDENATRAANKEVEQSELENRFNNSNRI